MSTRSQLTKDLNDSVTALLGKRIKILFKNVVRLETKADKTENRVVVFSPCRLFLLTAKVPTRIDCHFHYLEIRGIDSKKPFSLSFLVGEKHFTFLCNNETEVESMLSALSTALQVIFPGVSLHQVIDGKLSVDCQLPESLRPRQSHSPCGSYSTQYACMCDYHALPYREEVAWDVDTIYASHSTRELSLRDFDHLEPKDLVPIVSALEHNQWFHSLRACSLKLTHEAVDRILTVAARSTALGELHLTSLSLKHDFVSRLASAVQANPNIPLHTIDLCNNLLEDKSVPSLMSIFTKISQNGKQGLVAIELGSCGLGPKGVGALTQSLASLRLQTLVKLNLSHNSIKEEVSGLCSLLAEPNNIKYLDISATEILLDSAGCCQVFGALLRGCTTHLEHLDVSKNSFALKKSAREMPPSFKQFFTSSLCLKYLNFSHCKLPMEALKNLLLGLACNESTVGLTLDLSCNALGSHGSHVLESCIHGVRAVSSLDISENGLEGELGGVVTAVGRNKSIVELSLSRNLAGMKPKHITPVVDALVHMIQEDDCVLESLVLTDCRLKAELHPVINALGSNQCLKTLDISGNSMGDGGARLLAKALQTNTRLKSIIIDRNNLSVNGYAEIAYALTSNWSLVSMGCLVHDVSTCFKLSPDRTDQLLSSISHCLYRNSTQPSKGLRRQPANGWLNGGQQQALERAVHAVQDCVVRHDEGSTVGSGSSVCDSLMESHPAVAALLRDAHHAKMLSSKLTGVMEGADITPAVNTRITQALQDITTLLQQHLQSRVDEMVSVAREVCPTVVTEGLASSLRARATARIQPLALPDQPTTLLQFSELTDRATESGTVIASQLAERITEEIIDQLSKAQQTLMGDKRSSTPDVLRTMPRQTTDPSHPLATPQLTSRRKSALGRKLRPNSVVDTFSAEHIPDLLPSITSNQDGFDWESLDSVCEGSGQPRLQHLGKGRPRRAKTRAPSRPVNHLPHPHGLTDTEDGDTDNQSLPSEASSLPAPKPRPWSALCNDKSEGWSEASTATNTPDSNDPPSLNSTEGSEKKSVKDLAANIGKQLDHTEKSDS